MTTTKITRAFLSDLQREIIKAFPATGKLPLPLFREVKRRDYLAAVVT